MFIYSPLDQFDIFFFKTLSVYGYDNIYFFSFDVGNVSLLFIIVSVVICFYSLFIRFAIFKPSFLQYCFEFIYKFIIEMLRQQIGGKEGLLYFPYFYTIFIFISFSNLSGMLPFSFTLTAHLSITFTLAFSFNLGFIFLGFFKHGWTFLNLFVPTGTPKQLLPLIVLIEVVSYLIRTLSLSIRLFANMMAGHCLSYVISPFVFSSYNSYSFYILPIVILVYMAVLFLEFAIAFLQAYVSTILLAIYLNDSLHPGH